MKEKIIHAAVKIGTKVYIGNNHGDILTVITRYNTKPELLKHCLQGFYTDKQKFVSRSHAAVIAFNCSQIKERNNALSSDDLELVQLTPPVTLLTGKF